MSIPILDTSKKHRPMPKGVDNTVHSRPFKKPNKQMLDWQINSIPTAPLIDATASTNLASFPISTLPASNPCFVPDLPASILLAYGDFYTDKSQNSGNSHSVQKRKEKVDKKTPKQASISDSPIVDEDSFNVMENDEQVDGQFKLEDSSEETIDFYEAFNQENVKSIKASDYEVTLPFFMNYGTPPVTVGDAYSMIDFTTHIAKTCKSGNIALRRCIFFLVWYGIHKFVGIGRSYLFKGIIKESGISRSTAYDYVNAAIVETKLNITQGIMSVDALVYLKQHAVIDDWQDIFDNGMENRKVLQEINKSKKKKKHRRFGSKKKQNEYLTTNEVKEAIKRHNQLNKDDSDSDVQENNDSTKPKVARNKSKSKFNDWELENTAIDLTFPSAEVEYTWDDDIEPSATRKELLEKALAMSAKDKKIMLDVLLNLTEPAKLAFQLAEKLDDEQLDELIITLQKGIE